MKGNIEPLKAPEDTLTVNEAWKLLKVGRKTIYKLVKTKRLKAWKQGRIIRILRRDIERLFESP